VNFFLKHAHKLIIFGTHNLQTLKHNTLINKLLLMQFYLINICPKLHHRKWRKFYASHCLVNMSTVPNFLDFTINAVLHSTFIWKLCYKLSSTVTFTFIQIFLIKIVPSLLNGIRVSTFAWYSVKIGVIFAVRFERQKVDKKSKHRWKLKHANSILETFEYFRQISSKMILTLFWVIPLQSWCIFWDTVYDFVREQYRTSM